jgi:hypothetical protein
MFKDGAAIECFIAGEEPVKGVLISLDGKEWGAPFICSRLSGLDRR